MEPARRSAPRRLLIITDAVLVALAALAAFQLHAPLRAHFPQIRATPTPGELVTVSYLAAPVMVGCLVLFRLHTVFERVWSGLELFVTLLEAQLLSLVGLSLVLFLTQLTVNRSLVALFMAIWFVASWLERWLIARWLAWRHRAGQATETLLFAGSPGPAMASVAARAAADPLPPKVLGFVGPPPEQPIAVARIADLDELAAIVAREPIDLLMVFEPVVDEDALRRGVEACEARGVPVAFHVGRAGLRGVPRTAAVLDQPFVIHEIAPKSPDALAIKHAFDFVAALVGVVVLLPVWIVVSLAILVTMGRPVLFVQERAGLNGRRFSVLKFRTMIHDAEAAKSRLRHLNEAGGPMFKMTGDPRVTRLGRFLRKTSLDELPQLFNVLTGSMSLVGPRPLPIDEQRAITGWHQRRLSMRPGITGLWQVNGRSDVPFEQCMRYDLEYVDGWSLVRDARILLKTIPAVLSRKGAR